MKLRVIHIFAVCAALSFLMGCSCNKTHIIPRGKMAHIYAEMLVADQWLLENAKLRFQADTSLVYEPIFQSYGYTTEDYRASVEYYMNDPERYSRILRSTSEILEKQIDELKVLKAKEDREKAVVPYKINPDRLYFGRSKDRLWEYGDSVSAALDSLTPVYELGFHEVSATTFDGLNIVINVDTLAVKDTLPVKDTLLAKDSVVTEKPEPVEVIQPVTKPVTQTEPVKKPTPVEEKTVVRQPVPAPRPFNPQLKTDPVKVKEPQKLTSTTLDSLKRK